VAATRVSRRGGSIELEAVGGPRTVTAMAVGWENWLARDWSWFAGDGVDAARIRRVWRSGRSRVPGGRDWTSATGGFERELSEPLRWFLARRKFFFGDG